MRQEKSALTAQDILKEYESGFYTAGETVSRSIEALAGSRQRDQLWHSLPDWVRQRIDEILSRLSVGDQVMTFGHADPQVVHDEWVEMKRWREANPSQDGRDCII
jgi:hypothetical protein